MSYLQEAFREAARREFAMIPDEEEIDYSFSPKFLRKMRGLLRAEAYGYWKYVNTAAKRVAIAVAIIVMLLTSAMAIRPVRDHIIKFFIEIYEDFLELTFNDNNVVLATNNGTIMTKYSFSEVPTGYSEDNTIFSDSFLWTTWQSSDGSGFSLKQDLGSNKVTIDNKGSKLSTISFSDLQVSYYTHNSRTCYIWEQYGYIFTLTVHREFPISEVENMITSLFIVE